MQSQSSLAGAEFDALVSFAGRAVPFTEAVAALADQSRVSLNVAADDVPSVDVDLFNVSLRNAIRTLASLADLSVSNTAGIVTFDRPSNRDRFIRIVDPGFFEASQAATILGELLGDDVDANSVDGRLIVSVVPDQLPRLTEVERIFQVGPDSWAVSVQVFEVSASWQKRSGVDWAVIGTASLGLDAGDVDDSGVTAAFASLITASAEYSGEEGGVRLVLSSLLHLVEGRSVSLNRGDVLRIPRRTVSPQGTSTVVEFELIETGLQIDIQGRRVPNGLYLDVRPSISDVVGFVDSAPTVAERSVQSAAILRSGQPMVITGLDSYRGSEERDASGLPFGSRAVDTSELSLGVVVRAVRVQSASSLAEG